MALIICPECGKEVSSLANICVGCGYNLSLDKGKDIEKFKYPSITIFSYILGFVSVSMGFYKMFFYENPESVYLDSVNAYVGGDAYNYIINGNYAISYFVLALILVVFGSTFAIIRAIQKTI